METPELTPDSFSETEKGLKEWLSICENDISNLKNEYNKVLSARAEKQKKYDKFLSPFNDKLKKLDALTAIAPTAMVGDGINDAPALAKATIGISLSNASHIAIQSAQVILMNQGLKNFRKPLKI